MSEIILRTDGLCKQFGEVTAVNEVDLSVSEGEIFGFLGPNGAGKTTTIGMILGLIRPTAGSISIFGQPLTPGRNSALRQVGSLVGAPTLVPYLTGRENLRLLARLHADVDAARVEAVLALMDMSDAADRPVKGYSTGMKQRLGLAAALLHRPALVVLDEPTNGLDPAGMREVRELIRALADEGITVFLSSHLLHEVEQVCDRIAVIHQGRIVTEGSVETLLSQPEPVVRLRVSEPGAAATTLQTLPGLTELTHNGAYVEIRGVASETAVAHLTQNGIIPSEVLSQKSDLESLFLSLTKEEGRR